MLICNIFHVVIFIETLTPL